MASPNENETNPYRAPATELGGTHAPGESSVDRTVVKKFREQVLALGVLWMILGSALAVVAVLGLSGNVTLPGASGGDMRVMLGVFVALGSTWLVLGIFSCLKHMWAIYAGLVLSYLSLLGNFMSLNLCGIVIVILVIIQAHRVIGWAKQLRAAGLPLTAKP